MANDYFQFKQFRILQEHCAMKVSTDACIQGAWAASILGNSVQPRRVLDIGTGTGLLSLMLAQQHPDLNIDGLEIDPGATRQALENIKASPWPQRVKVWPVALQDFIREPAHAGAYDYIICNPPFFHNQLQSIQQQRNQARHSISLSKELLAAATVRLLRNEGICCILYPAREWEAWHHIALQHGLHLQQSLSIQPDEHKAPNRIAGIYTLYPQHRPGITYLTIRQHDGHYTPEFISLLQPYYLHL
jgi:tRNA1Val (adenine37-N6)-methyltransferase